MANNHIQSGDFSVLSSTLDYPILQNSSSYEYSIEGKDSTKDGEEDARQNHCYMESHSLKTIKIS